MRQISCYYRFHLFFTLEIDCCVNDLSFPKLQNCFISELASYLHLEVTA